MSVLPFAGGCLASPLSCSSCFRSIMVSLGGDGSLSDSPECVVVEGEGEWKFGRAFLIPVVVEL